MTCKRCGGSGFKMNPPCSTHFKLLLILIPIFLVCVWFLPGCKKAVTAQPASQPVVEAKKTSFITVNILECGKIKNIYGKRQLSKLRAGSKDPLENALDKMILYDGEECGIIYSDARIRKSRIRAYTISSSILLMKEKKYEQEPDAPLEIEELNVEHCVIYLEKPQGVPVEQKCSEIDRLLEE